MINDIVLFLVIWGSIAASRFLKDWQCWHWLVRANARRKRVERALRKERVLSDSLHLRNLSLLATCNELLQEANKATKLARSLAGELVEEVLTAQDQESVTKGLTRKL